MNVLITGANGQVGKELLYTCPKNINVTALDKNNLDICEYSDVKAAFDKYKPNLVINAAAYTSVEKAEVENDIANKVNRDAVFNLAFECHKNNLRLFHYSTDYIFDGLKKSPYTIYDKPNPINIYGKSKLEGEIKALETCPDNVLVIRTSWVYSKHGNNFVKSMLRLMSNKESIEIITDQIGAPTWARSIADLTWKAVENPSLNGIIHYCDNGATSWFEFAKEIKKEANLLGMINNNISINPITSKEYDSLVNRPQYSVLDCSETLKSMSLDLHINWKTNLKNMLSDFDY